ncbi:hypothetical protein HW115_17855 [Verrucomicrobiaceae bacterium N1E253]|uniref:Uncharacterized protein n=1 Tax=Oceaniferula marina TaxID=2748318 RepID=A0A851GR69_9BACT|nr:hypothetical protein [Oceaniferula marina]NWK57487.1 hypothetical protein [Oceaniferula marina]
MLNPASIWLVTLACLLAMTSCNRPPSEKPNKESKQDNSPQAAHPSEKLTSRQLKEVFPLYPLVEAKRWQELLRLEQLVSNPEMDQATRRESQKQIDKLAAQLQQLHPFSQDEDSVTLGLITYNRHNGSIEVMAEVNDPASHQQSREDIEVILCTPKGRTHESLFITDARPLHLELLLLLTGYSNANTEEAPPARFAIQVSLPNQAPIPLHHLLSTQDQKQLATPMLWEFTGSPFDGLYRPDLTGDLIISWHAHDAVLVSANKPIASNQTRLQAKSHPALTSGIKVKLLLIAENGQP